MNENDIDQPAEPQITEIQIGPGQRLRLAREAKKLSLKEAAARLHVQQRVIEGLENDDYSALPASVFAQGYLRKYARLLDEPADEIVSLYNSQRSDPEYTPTLHKFEMKMKTHQASSLGDWIRWIPWVLAAAIALAVAAWWQGYFPIPLLDQRLERVTASVGDDDKETDIAEPLGSLGENQATAEQVSTVDLTTERKASEARAVVDGPSSTSSPGGISSQPDEFNSVELARQMDDTNPQTPFGDSAQAATASEVGDDRTLAVDMDPLMSEPSDRSVMLEFDAPCWVDIRDSTGEKILCGGIGGGETHLLEGVPPYQVVLGNSEVVNVIVDGVPYDIGQHARGKVARFSLDPANIPTTDNRNL